MLKLIRQHHERLSMLQDYRQQERTARTTVWIRVVVTDNILLILVWAVIPQRHRRASQFLPVKQLPVTDTRIKKQREPSRLPVAEDLEEQVEVSMPAAADHIPEHSLVL